MIKLKIASGTLHKLPKDMKEHLGSSQKALDTWENITPLARNEWICWVESAKKGDTRINRMKRAKTELSKGKRRPCCWAGCPHR